MQGKRWQRAQKAERVAQRIEEPVVSYNQFDRALLGLELVGALVIASLLLSTFTRSISIRSTQDQQGVQAKLAQVVGRLPISDRNTRLRKWRHPSQQGPDPKVTPTRIAEVAPPLMGDGTGRPTGTR